MWPSAPSAPACLFFKPTGDEPAERQRGTRGAQCSRPESPRSAQASYQSCGNAVLRAKSTWPRMSANIWEVPDSAGVTGTASQAPASKTKNKKERRGLDVGNVRNTCVHRRVLSPPPHNLHLSGGHESSDRLHKHIYSAASFLALQTFLFF